MKKILSVLLAVCLLVSCSAVFAEEEKAGSFDFSAIGDLTLLKEAKTEKMVSMKDISSYAFAESKDAVNISGSMISVRTRGLTLLLDLPDAYICFTQDYFASIRSYAGMNDPENLQNFMVQTDSHFYLYDEITQIETTINSLPQDKACVMLWDLSTLNESDLNLFGETFAEVNGITFDGIYRTDTAAWMRFTGSVNVYLTIVGGEYIAYYYYETEQEDAEEMLSNLSVFG